METASGVVIALNNGNFMANLTCANAIMLFPYRYHHSTLSSGRIDGTDAEGVVVMTTNNVA